MKKSLIILFIFLFLFSACQKQPLTQETTAESLPESSTSKAFNDLTTDLQKEVINPTQTPTENNSTVYIKNNTSNSSKETIQSSSPMIIFITLDELKEIKKAYDSMTAYDFQNYMQTEHTDACMTGMWDYENSTVLLNEMCSTYVPVLDNNPDNLSELGFYWQSNSIHQLLIFDGDKRASVIINTVKNTESKELQLNNDAISIFKKTIEKDNYISHLYEYQNTDYRFYADVLIDDTYIVLRSDWIDTTEDFEECFSRLSFVKIGDLL